MHVPFLLSTDLSSKMDQWTWYMSTPSFVIKSRTLRFAAQLCFLFSRAFVNGLACTSSSTMEEDWNHAVRVQDECDTRS